MNRILYFTSWYAEKDDNRRTELEACLERTVNNPEVHAVYLLCESAPPFEHPNLFAIYSKRPTYSEIFSRANLIGKEGDTIIIANTDLFPERGFSSYLQHLKKDECFALSRWDYSSSTQESVLWDHKDSQDVWIFQHPINEKIEGNFFLGKPGCDNAIAERIQRAGYIVTNPSKSIKFVHVHESEVWNYSSSETIPQPYFFPEPCELVIKPTIRINKVLHVGFSQPGLERAFKGMSELYTFIEWTAYQNNLPELNKKVLETCEANEYDLIFFHIQTGGVIDTTTLTNIKKLNPNSEIVNWTGDVRREVEAHYVETGRLIDLTCFSNVTDVETIRTRKVNAKYLQIGFDQEIYKPGRSTKEWPEIVFLGNHYPGNFPLSELRENTVKLLKQRYGNRFGVYGSGWSTDLATGNLMGKEQEEADCYRGCKIAISISHFNYKRYYSDRQLRIMGAGACCLSKTYPGCYDDFKSGEEIVFFSGMEDLYKKIDWLLENDDVRRSIAHIGSKKVHAECTWENRIEELLTLL